MEYPGDPYFQDSMIVSVVQVMKLNVNMIKEFNKLFYMTSYTKL